VVRARFQHPTPPQDPAKLIARSKHCA
jgi:hypothetical protein